MAAAMGEQLKRYLHVERTSKLSKPLCTSTPALDGSDLDDTSIDLYEPIKRQKLVIMTSEEEGDDSILPQEEPECQQQPEKVLVELDEETLKALKELPGLVATMKTVLDNISKSPGSSVCSSSPSHSDSQRTGSDTGSDDLMFLGNSAVQVSKRLYQRISSRRMSLFTQDLATLIFGKDTLAKSTLTGKGKKGEVKDQLDPEKMNAIIDTVRERFPNSEVSEIRALLRRKCNNDGYTKVAPQ